jgi:hypothetical protein
MSSGSAPLLTASGSGASGGSWGRSSSQANNRTNGRRPAVAGFLMGVIMPAPM